MQAGLAAIRAAFGEPVDYRHSSDANVIPNLSVIWSDAPGDVFQGAGNTTRTITAEIEIGTVPARPTAATRIMRKGVVWRVTQVVDREDVDAWMVTLEKA